MDVPKRLPTDDEYDEWLMQTAGRDPVDVMKEEVQQTLAEGEDPKNVAIMLRVLDQPDVQRVCRSISSPFRLQQFLAMIQSRFATEKKKLLAETKWETIRQLWELLSDPRRWRLKD